MLVVGARGPGCLTCLSLCLEAARGPGAASFRRWAVGVASGRPHAGAAPRQAWYSSRMAAQAGAHPNPRPKESARSDPWLTGPVAAWRVCSTSRDASDFLKTRLVPYRPLALTGGSTHARSWGQRRARALQRLSHSTSGQRAAARGRERPPESAVGAGEPRRSHRPKSAHASH